MGSASVLTVCLMVFTLAMVVDLSHAACKSVTLKSGVLKKLKETTVTDAAQVTSMTATVEISQQKCEGGSSANYGFYGPLVWVNNGCHASFKVCYIRGRTKQVRCTSKRSGSKSTTYCPVPANSRSVAILRRGVFSRKCIQGSSFYLQGRNLVVRNGCKGTFVVGYVP